MHRILLIDDEETLLKNISDFLKVSGYTVFTATNGKDGVDVVKAENPDLLLLDLHLKEGPTGTQVLRVSKMVKPELKVIMFTGFGDDEDVRSECMSGGADGFLTKPTSLKNIAETIKGLLEGAK